MLYGLTHFVQVIRYGQKLLAYVMPVIRYVSKSNTSYSVTRYVLKFLTYVLSVIRYVTQGNTSYSIYKVWSKAAGIRCDCRKVCYIDYNILFLS